MTKTTVKTKNKRIFDVVFTVILIFSILFVVFLTRFWITLSVVDGDSMNNTLIDGDILITNNLKKPKFGDIVVFEFDNNENYIKRIIATEGDVIYNDEHGNVWLKKAGEEQASILIEPYLDEGVKTGIQFYCEVQEGEYFVMGDNRGNSQDSRIIGAIKKEQIIGVVSDFWVEKKEFTTKLFNFRRK